MNDYGNNILLASQNGCDLVQIVDGGGNFPVGAKVFYYKDNDGNTQGFDITNTQRANRLFQDNQNIAVDWEVDMPNAYYVEYMFNNSTIKSFKNDQSLMNTGNYMFTDCVHLTKAMVNMNNNGKIGMNANCTNMFENCINLTDVEVYADNSPLKTNMSSPVTSKMFKNCINIRKVKYTYEDYYCQNMIATAIEMFCGCTSLDDISLSYLGRLPGLFQATDMFKGCRLGPKQLQQVLDVGFKPISTSIKITTTIGYDPALVDPNVDKPEGSDNTWAEEFAAKGWTVTWEAYEEPVANAPKRLMAKGAKQKLYKLDEVPDEVLEFVPQYRYVYKGRETLPRYLR